MIALSKRQYDLRYYHPNLITLGFTDDRHIVILGPVDDRHIW